VDKGSRSKGLFSAISGKAWVIVVVQAAMGGGGSSRAMREHWAARGHAVQGGNHDASISYRKAVCVPSCTSPRLLSVPSRLYHGLPYRLRPLCSKEYEASNIPKNPKESHDEWHDSRPCEGGHAGGART
jgi:hypothetical protein